MQRDSAVGFAALVALTVAATSWVMDYGDRRWTWGGSCKGRHQGDHMVALPGAAQYTG